MDIPVRSRAAERVKKSLMRRILICPGASLLIMATAGLTCDSGMPAPEENLCILRDATLTGTIDEVENVVVNLLASNPNSTDSLATRDVHTHIEFNLRSRGALNPLEGTAKVRQTRHLTTVSAVPVQGCGDTLYTDYDDREWTVNITAEVTCRQVGQYLGRLRYRATRWQ